MNAFQLSDELDSGGPTFMAVVNHRLDIITPASDSPLFPFSFLTFWKFRKKYQRGQACPVCTLDSDHTYPPGAWWTNACSLMSEKLDGVTPLVQTLFYEIPPLSKTYPLL